MKQGKLGNVGQKWREQEAQLLYWKGQGWGPRGGWGVGVGVVHPGLDQNYLKKQSCYRAKDVGNPVFQPLSQVVPGLMSTEVERCVPSE